METSLWGTGAQVVIGPGQPLVIIGNRIHGARNPEIAEAVRRMDMGWIQHEAGAQAEEGAHVIGVWVGMEGVDEAQTLTTMVETVSKVVSLPLCVGTADPKALAAALGACSGKPLVSPITAESVALKELIPVAMEHEAAIVAFGRNRRGLPREFEGFPNESDVPFELTRVVLRRALAVGIPREDIVVGVSPGSISDEPAAVVDALNLVEKLTSMEQLNVALETVPAMPRWSQTDVIAQVLLALGLRDGVTCAFADPAKVCGIAYAADLLLNRRKCL